MVANLVTLQLKDCNKKEKKMTRTLNVNPNLCVCVNKEKMRI